jgi:Protein of unknown function (DUF1659)
MAMEELLKKSLVLTFEEGVNPEDGKPIIKRYAYSNIDKDVTTENLFQAAQALSSLYHGVAYGFTTVDTNDLVNF